MIHAHAVQSSLSILLDTTIVVIASIFIVWFITPLIFKSKDE